MSDQRPHVLKHKRTTLEHAEKFINSQSSTVNLLSRLYPHTAPVSHVEVSSDGQYYPCKIGDQFGTLWSSHWFRLTVNIPSEWLGKEVHLRWKSQSEAMLWKNGTILQAFTALYDRTDYTISKNLKENELDQQFYVEMTCSDLFGAGKDGLIQPPDKTKKYTLEMVEIAVMDPVVRQLLIDMSLLVDIASHLPDSNRGYHALYTVNHMVSLCQKDHPQYEKARQIGEKFLSMKNGDSQITIHAMGHCHIDTAWLWPYAETKRKCARSWTNVCNLLDEYEDFTFVCSQAQQYQWVKEIYPTLFDRIKDWVTKGRFIPAGGTWVEMDGNLPSGESFIRQFLHGQKFYKEEFGLKCEELWLPDTFGYSAQLPQILQHVGIKRFLTQKISWNLLNKFPHHTFYWAGIDGSEVLTHFPPGDTYTAKATVEDCVKTLNNFRDKGRSQYAALVYGHGDGGQGPTEDMIERLGKLKDCDGLPRVKMSSPEELFSALEDEDDNQYCKWVGELFLELHNATYTTQAEIKKGNRKGEFQLLQCDLLLALSYCTRLEKGQVEEDISLQKLKEKLDKAWKLLLLNQFHDVLPGSCIREVVKDALKYYKEITEICTKGVKLCVENIFGKESSEQSNLLLFNPTSFVRRDVIAIDDHQPISVEQPNKRPKLDSASQIEYDSYGKRLLLTEVPSYGYSSLQTAVRHPEHPVTVTKCRDTDHIIMENGLLKAVIDHFGRITELYAFSRNEKSGKVRVSKNLFSEEQPGNELVIYDDVPLYWDAWDVMDYHMESRQSLIDQVHQNPLIQSARIVDNTSLRATVEVSLKISDASYIKQSIILDADSCQLKFETEVEWHEKHKFLKVEFPAQIQTDYATYEIQYGHLNRPTHYNTTWEQAKFEVCGHKWFHVGQHDLGLAVINDCKYGMSCRDNVMRLSLLRSPTAPDPKADQGCHNFTYSLLPHLGSLQSSGVIKQAYLLNVPTLELMTSSALTSKSYFSLESEAVVLDCVKVSEDHNNVLVLRFYESFGGDCRCKVKCNVPLKDARLADGLENVMEDSPSLLDAENGVISLEFKPFQIKTVMVQL